MHLAESYLKQLLTILTNLSISTFWLILVQFAKLYKKSINANDFVMINMPRKLPMSAICCKCCRRMVPMLPEGSSAGLFLLGIALGRDAKLFFEVF